jgi:DNA-binding response OmpR family regulator
MEKAAIAVNSPVTPARASVLCIDDSPGMLMICRTILEAHGYSVLTASKASAGLELLEHNVVKAAVIDDGLQDMNTNKVVREMRRICPALAIVVFTRSSRPESEVSATEICVPKSDGPKALLAAINGACERARGSQG